MVALEFRDRDRYLELHKRRLISDFANESLDGAIGMHLLVAQNRARPYPLCSRYSGKLSFLAIFTVYHPLQR